ncbi:MAG TPA: hypothetical protein VJB06_00085 [archaeon]|nr:hypothetical protein [archaeon]
MRRFSKYLSSMAGFLLAGCVTYSENISIYDTQGKVYRKPRNESSWELKRNRSERLTLVPPGRQGFLTIEYYNGEMVRKEARIYLAGKSLVVMRAPDGEIAVYDVTREDCLNR